MAAIGAIASLLKSGDHVVVSDNVYGGTFRLFDKVLTRYQLSFTYVDTADLDAVERAITPTTRMLFVETPSNPVMRLTDLRAAADLAHAHGVRLVVDNTFASPYIQRPIEFGADLVTHSTTKYLQRPQRQRRRRRRRHARRRHRVAAVRAERRRRDPGAVRLVAGAARHEDAAGADGAAQRQRARRWPSSSRRIRRSKHVYYPGLPAHPQHELARRQMRGFGGMLAFETGSLEAARRVLNACGCSRSPRASAASRR